MVTGRNLLPDRKACADISVTGENHGLDRSLFIPASEDEKASILVMRESTTFWQDAWRRLKSNRLAIAALIVIALLILISIFAPFFSPYSYDEINKGSENLRPSPQFLFGTDSLGRDLFVRCMIGTRISLSIGIVSAIMIVIIGVVYGAISGFFGGFADNIMMRIVDIVYALPTTLIVILLQVVLKEPLEKLFQTSELFKSLAFMGSSLISIYVVLALLYWVDMARIVRGQILVIREQEYIMAARAVGAGNFRIIFKHIVPNAIGPIIVVATFKIPQAIFLEAFLSFIGLGVSKPLASLGSLTNDALSGIYSFPYQLFFPAFLISLVILSFNLFGDGLRDALDPRLKNRG